MIGVEELVDLVWENAKMGKVGHALRLPLQCRMPLLLSYSASARACKNIPILIVQSYFCESVGTVSVMSLPLLDGGKPNLAGGISKASAGRRSGPTFPVP